MTLSRNPVSSESLVAVLHCIPFTPGGAVEHVQKRELNKGRNAFLCVFAF